MGNDKDENDNGKKGRGITIKMDGSMITALIALLTAGGFGLYGTASGVGDVEIKDTRDGVTIQVNEANRKAASRDKKLARLVKRQQREIDELYETVEWLVSSLAEVGKHHPAAWRKLRRKAPDYIADLVLGGGVGRLSHVMMESTTGAPPDEEDPESIFDEVESEPEQIEFPSLDKIRGRR